MSVLVENSSNVGNKLTKKKVKKKKKREGNGYQYANMNLMQMIDLLDVQRLSALCCAISAKQRRTKAKKFKSTKWGYCR